MAAAVKSTPSARASGSLRFLDNSTGVHGNAPWFEPGRLSDPDFSVDAFVADFRQYAPLEALGGELDKYLATLKGKVGHQSMWSALKAQAFRYIPHNLQPNLANSALKLTNMSCIFGVRRRAGVW